MSHDLKHVYTCGLVIYVQLYLSYFCSIIFLQTDSEVDDGSDDGDDGNTIENNAENQDDSERTLVLMHSFLVFNTIYLIEEINCLQVQQCSPTTSSGSSFVSTSPSASHTE